MVRRQAPHKPGPAQVRLGLRRFLAVGEGWMVGLDTVPGISHARIVDNQIPGVWVRPGVGIVFVVGGDRGKIQQLLEDHEGTGVALVLVHRPSTAWDRSKANMRWRWWQARHRRPYGVLPAWLYSALPAWVKSSPPLVPTAAKGLPPKRA